MRCSGLAILDGPNRALYIGGSSTGGRTRLLSLGCSKLATALITDDSELELKLELELDRVLGTGGLCQVGLGHVDELRVGWRREDGGGEMEDEG